MIPWLPGILFGGLAIGGSLLILALPETLNRPLPQTIEDIENWAKKDKSKKLPDEVPDSDSVEGSAAPASNPI